MGSSLAAFLMNESATSRHVIHLGAFELDLRAGELSNRGLKLKLQELPDVMATYVAPLGLNSRGRASSYSHGSEPIAVGHRMAPAKAG